MEVFIAVLEDRNIGYNFDVFRKQHDAMVYIGKWQKAEEDRWAHDGSVDWEIDKYPDHKSGLWYRINSKCDDGPTMELWKKEVQ